MSEGPQLNSELLDSLSLEEATSQDILRTGELLYKRGQVRLLARSNMSAHLMVRDDSGRGRTVILKVRIGRRGDPVVGVDCDCSDAETGIMCRHIVAAFLALKDTLRGAPPQRPAWEKAVDGVLQELSSEAVAAATSRRGGGGGTRSLLFFSVQERSRNRWGVYLYSLAASRFSLPTDATGPVQDAAEIARAIKSQKLSGSATGVRTFDLTRFPFLSTAEQQAAITLAAYNQHSYYSYYSSDGTMEQVLPLLADSEFVYQGTEANPLRQRVKVLPPGVLTAALAVRKNGSDGGLVLTPALLRQADGGAAAEQEVPFDPKQDRLVFRDPPYVLTGKGVLASLSGAPAAFRSLVENQRSREKKEANAPAGIVIPAGSRDAFFARYLLPLAEQMPITGDGVVWEEESSPPAAVPRAYLTEQAGTLRVQLRFAYKEQELNYDPALPMAAVTRGVGAPNALRRLERDRNAEQEAYDLLAGGSVGLKRDDPPGTFVLRARVAPIDFLLRHVPRLTQVGFEVFGEENIASVRVNRNKPVFNFGVSSGIDWFDVEAVLKFGDTTAAFADVKKAIRNRERYVKLADGSIGAVPPEWVDKFRFLFSLAEDTENGLRLSATQALLLDQAIADSDGEANVDAEFAARRERLRSFDHIAAQPLPPTGLTATLYPYQKAGYDWLHFLHDYHFGGCLADEMGLGKTIVTLAFLLSLRRSMAVGQAPHTLAPDLIVVPRSLLFNWEREAGRFTPDLRVRVHADGSRLKDAAALTTDCDLIVTTYGILLRDIETLRAARFHYAVLDEAQAIKNPLSQTARAARLLTAEHRLTLTGTPVENGTLELWSQFAFLNPGLLGGLERFKTEFAGAIERRQDENAAIALRSLTSPFLLRRTKDQVARDLPPRTEHLVYTEMEAAQRRLYDKLRDQYRAQVLGMLDEAGGSGKAQIKILEGLLRLRQVCCHPRLVDKEFKGESAKFQILLETLDSLRAEGHKALIFSQFTQMLALVREEMDQRGLPYLYLDGRTRDRQSIVDAFQNDPAMPFFLISLKAGGVGLNLTAADYVLHLDPWWNPAVERQATDRSHRIGQTRPVFVYKYVMRDSVEEKILTLQERKRALVDQLVTAETSVYKSLSRTDVEALFS